MSANVEQLLQAPMCRGLTAAEATSIAEIAEQQPLPKGALIFQESDAGDALYLVVSGQVEIVKRDKGGIERQLAVLEAGAVVGEMTLVSEETRRSATARALTPLTLVKIPGARFRELVAKDNVAALKLVRNFAQVMSKRLLAMDEKVVEALSAAGGKKEELGDFNKLLQGWSF